MGVKERHDREREAVGRAILDAARDLFVTEGYSNVSIRKIAERIEYSPAAIYSYFSSKDDIFFALAEEGFRLLLAHAEAVIETPDPLDGVRRAFWRLYEFSKEHPEYYALMFIDRTVPRISRSWPRFGFVRDGVARVGAAIQRCVDAGHFPPGSDPEAVFRIVSTAVQGAATWGICCRLTPGEDVDALARDTLEATLTGLRHGSPVTFRPVSCGQPEGEQGDS